MTKKQAIESILENESIGDGLADEHAKQLIDWCIQRIEGASSDVALVETLDQVRLQARVLTKLFNAVEFEEDADELQRWLGRCPLPAPKQHEILGLLQKRLPLEQKIAATLEALEGE